MDFDLLAIAQHAGMVGQLVHEAVDRPFGPPGGPGLQALAEEHDEHGLGGRQVFSDRQGRARRYDDREVCRDLALEELGNGPVKGLVARQHREEDRCVDSKQGIEDAEQVQQQQDADDNREPYVLDLLAAVAIYRMVLGDDMHW